MSRMSDHICNMLQFVSREIWINTTPTWKWQIMNFDFNDVLLRGLVNNQNHDELCPIALSQSLPAADHSGSFNQMYALFVGSTATQLSQHESQRPCWSGWIWKWEGIHGFTQLMAISTRRSWLIQWFHIIINPYSSILTHWISGYSPISTWFCKTCHCQSNFHCHPELHGRFECKMLCIGPSHANATISLHPLHSIQASDDKLSSLL